MPNVYPHLVKTMDNLSTTDGIASDAQRYLDRGIKTDNVTENNYAYYTHRLQQSSHGNVPNKPRQPLGMKSPCHTDSW